MEERGKQNPERRGCPVSDAEQSQAAAPAHADRGRGERVTAGCGDSRCLPRVPVLPDLVCREQDPSARDRSAGLRARAGEGEPGARAPVRPQGGEAVHVTSECELVRVSARYL